MSEQVLATGSVRDLCPECGAALVANIYYVPQKGYMVALECQAGLQEAPTCTYRKML